MGESGSCWSNDSSRMGANRQIMVFALVLTVRAAHGDLVSMAEQVPMAALSAPAPGSTLLEHLMVPV